MTGRTPATPAVQDNFGELGGSATKPLTNAELGRLLKQDEERVKAFAHVTPNAQPAPGLDF